MQEHIHNENARLEEEQQFWSKEIVVRIEYKFCPNCEWQLIFLSISLMIHSRARVRVAPCLVAGAVCLCWQCVHLHPP